VLSPDGTNCLRRRGAGRADRPEELGRKVAAVMLADGADQILAGRGHAQAERTS